MSRRLKSPISDIAAVERLIANTRKNAKASLGDLCRMDIQNIEITPPEYERILAKHHFEEFKPVDIRKKTAARKAITAIRPELEDPAAKLKVFVRSVPTVDERFVKYAIVDEWADVTKEDLDFTTRNQVIFDREDGTLSFTRDDVPAIREKFDYYCSIFTDPEVKLSIYNILSKHGAIFLQDGSGQFFVPITLRETITDPLKEMFSYDLPQYVRAERPICYFRPIGIVNDADNRQTMAEALLADVEREMEEAERLLTDSMSRDKHKAKGVNGAVKKYKAARGKAMLFKDILEMNMEKLEERLRLSEERAADLLTTLEE